MKVPPLILTVLTLLVSIAIASTLFGSWGKPQVQSQLNLYQSDLMLRATEWEGLNRSQADSPSIKTSLLGADPLKEVIEQYQTVQTSVQQELARSQQAQSPATPSLSSVKPSEEFQEPISNTGPDPRPDTRRQLSDELTLRLGLLYAESGNRDKALKTWTALLNAPAAQESLQTSVPTAQVLRGLWSDPPQIFPQAEQVLNRHLKGWFRYQGLAKLYTVQQRPSAQSDLYDTEQAAAQSAFLRLLAVSVMPGLGSILGLIILVYWGVRAVLPRATGSASTDAEGFREAGVASPNALGNGTPEGGASMRSLPPVFAMDEGPLQQTVLWPKETIWQTMVLWFTAFFAVSYLVVPLTIAVLGLNPAQFTGRAQAYVALFSYVCLTTVGLGILQLSLRPFIPNVLKWLPLRFSANWIGWGISGYFVALPLVLVVSLLNQKLLQEQGGGNPILEIILQGHDRLTIGLLWGLVAICAPLFEETLFRGFLLTSLTRYIPAWQAITLSGVLFAVAHLNLGDLLPLSVLGMLLGYVYLRSRNLLASMLLHSLWNSGSFVGLLILGSSNT
ncbi:MAG TPA: type II CAAX endopeptidase family protein [Stenomitos sp.]